MKQFNEYTGHVNALICQVDEAGQLLWISDHILWLNYVTTSNPRAQLFFISTVLVTEIVNTYIQRNCLMYDKNMVYLLDHINTV